MVNNLDHLDHLDHPGRGEAVAAIVRQAAAYQRQAPLARYFELGKRLSTLFRGDEDDRDYRRAKDRLKRAWCIGSFSE